MKTIKLPCFNIEVQLDVNKKGGGCITSSLSDNKFLDELENDERDAHLEEQRQQKKLTYSYSPLPFILNQTFRVASLFYYADPRS